MSCSSSSKNSLLSSDKEGQESSNCGFVTSKERSLSRACIPPVLSTIPPTLLWPCPLSYVLGNNFFMDCALNKGRNLPGIMMGGQVMWKRGETIAMILEYFLMNSFYSICLSLSAFFVYACAELLLKDSWTISATVGVFFQYTFCFYKSRFWISSNIFLFHSCNSHFFLLTAKLFVSITWLSKQFYLSCTWKQRKSKTNIVFNWLFLWANPNHN